MRWQDNQGAIANQISGLAINSEAIGGIVGDLSAVLLVLGISKEDDAFNLFPDGGTAVANGGGDEGGALAVPITALA